MLVLRIQSNFISKRAVSHLFSPQYVLSQENREKASSKFSHMQPVRLTNFPPKKAAVLVPLCIMEGKMALLYTLRTSKLKNHRGQVSFPGGMHDTADKSILETALRETQEELGINPKCVDVWGSGTQLIARGRTTVTPVIGYITRNFSLSELALNKDEVEEAFYVTLEDLCNPKAIWHTQYRQPGQAIDMPVFTGGKMKIWGLTAMITYMFLHCLLPSRAYSHKIRQLPPIQIGPNTSDMIKH